MRRRNPPTTVLRFDVLKRDLFRCRYCGAEAPYVNLHVDHIHPVSMGGLDDIENLITSCRSCNSGKGARSLVDLSITQRPPALPGEVEKRRAQLELMLILLRDEALQPDEIVSRVAIMQIGRKGGKNRAARLSPERRSEIARIAAKAPRKKRAKVSE